MTIESFSINQAVDRGYGKLHSVRIRKDDTYLDAFGRDRSSEIKGLFESKLTYSDNGTLWHPLTNGVGASLTYVPAEAAVKLAVGTVSGEYAFRQGQRLYGYTPGVSHVVFMTGKFDVGKDNLVQRIGYFNDNDGPFFEVDGTTVNVVIRSSTSGSPVPDIKPQSEWNLDRLDGSGEPHNPSGIKLDYTKTQIFVIDFQWLGVGRVRFGFNIGGRTIYCHEFNHANSLDVVYMATPDVTPRYEIRNTGVTASASTLVQLCCSVNGEGGGSGLGTQLSTSNGIAVRVTGTTLAPLLAIRQKTTFNSIENHRLAEWLSSNVFSSDNIYVEIRHYHAPSGITATWADVDTDSSSVERSIDISTIAGDYHVLDSGYVSAGQGSSAGSGQRSVSRKNFHSLFVQNYDATNSEVIVVFVATITGAGTAGASLTWDEYD